MLGRATSTWVPASKESTVSQADPGHGRRSLGRRLLQRAGEADLAIAASRRGSSPRPDSNFYRRVGFLQPRKRGRSAMAQTSRVSERAQRRDLRRDPMGRTPAATAAQPASRPAVP